MGRKRSKSSVCFFFKVPDDIILCILSYLPPQDLIHINKVNKQLHELSNSDKLWEQICIKNGMNEIFQENWKKTFSLQFLIPEEIYLVVLGSGGVGKSTTVVQYVQRIFVERYDPTIEDEYLKVVTFLDKTSKLSILDTAGTERFTAMRDLYMKNGQTFIFAFSVTSKDSLSSLPYLIDQLSRVKDKEPQEIPFVISGNKVDLVEQRCVSFQEGYELAAKYGCPYVETSAKTNFNINKAFQLCCTRYVQCCQPTIIASRKKHKKRQCLLM